MAKKNLLAILGSPHADGATAAMLRCAIDAAQGAGWQVELVSLYQKNLAFCTGCRRCLVTHTCVLQDDLPQIAALLKSCDAVALAAPVYWANVPAAVKNLFDRLLGTAMEETHTFPKPRLSSGQKYLLLTACNTPAPFSWLCGQSSGAARAMKEFFHTAGMKRLGHINLPAATGKKALPKKISHKIAGFFNR